mgnify:CR=1 FL=1
MERVLGTPALFATAYGNVGSSIYYALGLTAVYALGLTPLVFLIRMRRIPCQKRRSTNRGSARSAISRVGSSIIVSRFRPTRSLNGSSASSASGP